MLAGNCRRHLHANIKKNGMETDRPGKPRSDHVMAALVQVIERLGRGKCARQVSKFL
jgi:hypothetical protein